VAWINFARMDESDDFCPTRPIFAMLIHADGSGDMKRPFGKHWGAL